MTSVTSAFIKVFESSGFECELIETEKEDQVRIPITEVKDYISERIKF